MFVKLNKIADFFPTPKKEIKPWVDNLDFIYSGYNILEPSAGFGWIADAIKEKCSYADDVTLDCVELQYDLAEHLASSLSTLE